MTKDKSHRDAIAGQMPYEDQEALFTLIANNRTAHIDELTQLLLEDTGHFHTERLVRQIMFRQKYSYKLANHMAPLERVPELCAKIHDIGANIILYYLFFIYFFIRYHHVEYVFLLEDIGSRKLWEEKQISLQICFFSSMNLRKSSKIAEDREYTL
jgi:hypothetical protein